MKKYILGALVSLAALPGLSQAASYNYTGTIHRITSIPGQDNRDYILVSGFSSAGTCFTVGGMVVAKIPSTTNGNRTFSLALAAKTAGKKVYIVVDDTVKNFEGHCVINALELVE